VLKAENDYRVTLTNVQGGQGGEAFGIFTPGAARIVVEGFVFTNADLSYTCPGGREANVLVHFQDACDIVFRDNILHGNNTPGACNELLKINRGDTLYYPRHITVSGNVFYDRPSAGGTDLIDAVRPGELDICDNIFFERSSPGSQSFITIKREVPDASIPAAYRPARSPRHRVYRNVFLNWDGLSDQAFVQFGEDADSTPMITNSVIENNLMIGNSARPIVAAIQLKGCRGITVRANTVCGNLPGGTYGLRIGTEGSNPRSSDFAIVNNVWSDPTGTMGTRFVNVYGDVDAATIGLDHNLFWNAGSALPGQGAVLPSADLNRIVSDPLLPTDQSSIVLPVWDDANHRFLSGSTTIREEFVRLVTAYGAIPAGSPARSGADPAAMPADDILGNRRDAAPDIGCYEFAGSAVVAGPYAPDRLGRTTAQEVVYDIAGRRIAGTATWHPGVRIVKSEAAHRTVRLGLR
jgi:hypothetical protein